MAWARRSGWTTRPSLPPLARDRYPDGKGIEPEWAQKVAADDDLLDLQPTPPQGKDTEMTGPPTTYHVRAEGLAGGPATIEAGNQRIPVDATWGSGEPSGLPGPAELLSGAFAACLLKNLERSGALLSFRYQRVEIDVHARRQDTPPRFAEIDYEVRIVTDEGQRRIELLHRNLRQFGTVFNTLAAVCDVHGRVVAVKPSPGQEQELGGS